MIKEAIATGRTVDDAIDKACTQLGVSRGDAEFEIIDLPRKGFLGLTQTPAKVKVWIEVAEPVVKQAPPPQQQPRQERPQQPKPEQQRQEQRQPRPEQTPVQRQPQPPQKQPQQPKPEQPRQERAEQVSDRPLSAQAIAAKEYLTDVLAQMGLGHAVLQVTQREDAVHIRLTGDENGAAIGRRGETLDALQYLTALAANRSGEDYARIVLDSGNYRDKRRRTLEQLAKRLAGNAVKTGKPTTLEPMNPYERRIIHAAVSEVEGAASSSVGEEPNRCVVISATGEAPAFRTPSDKPRQQGRGGDRDRDRDRKPGGGRGGRDSRSGGRDRDRGPRREKPEPYKESGLREVAPSEAKDQPLYGKIEL